MQKKNLSEELFKPRFEHPETSTLVRHLSAAGASIPSGHWYRTLLPLHWHFRGISPIESEEVLSRIAASPLARTTEHLLDTVRGYRNGNWNYEWSVQAARWQDKAQQEADPALAAQYGLRAANLFSIAAYPHLSGDELSDQAQVLAYRAYELAIDKLTVEVKKLTFEVETGKRVNAFLHLPEQAKAPYPTVMICGGWIRCKQTISGYSVII